MIYRIGIKVLKSWALRLYAGYLSYYDKKLSTIDAARIGRLHCLTKDWERASILFLKSGGFKVSNLISQVKQKTLIIWGRQDEIIDLSNAYKFQKLLTANELVIIDNCGHVPHVEKPEETARAIIEFSN